MRLLKSLVWPAVSYGCQSWMLKSTDDDRIKSFEIKAFRQILRVTWTDKRTNEVLRKAGIEPFLLQSVKKESFLIIVLLWYYGHVLRKEGNCMNKNIMQDRPTTSSQRRRERTRTRWQDNTKKVDWAHWWSFAEIRWRQTSMKEEDCPPRSGQSSDRGRLKVQGTR